PPPHPRPGPRRRLPAPRSRPGGACLDTGGLSDDATAVPRPAGPGRPGRRLRRPAADRARHHAPAPLLGLRAGRVPVPALPPGAGSLDFPAMEPLMYGELAGWWPLLSAPASYAEGAENYRRRAGGGGGPA